MEKIIITAAITGSRIPRSRTPYIPISPEEIAQSAYECWEAGASIAHIHVRDPETGGISFYKVRVNPFRSWFQLSINLINEKTQHLIMKPLSRRSSGGSVS